MLYIYITGIDILVLAQYTVAKALDRFRYEHGKFCKCLWFACVWK